METFVCHLYTVHSVAQEHKFTFGAVKRSKRGREEIGVVRRVLLENNVLSGATLCGPILISHRHPAARDTEKPIFCERSEGELSRLQSRIQLWAKDFSGRPNCSGKPWWRDPVVHPLKNVRYFLWIPSSRQSLTHSLSHSLGCTRVEHIRCEFRLEERTIREGEGRRSTPLHCPGRSRLCPPAVVQPTDSTE